MDFSTLVTTGFPSSAISCVFNSNTGVLTIKATYDETIEGTTHLVNISFDETKRYSASIELYPQLNGVNAKLAFSSFESYNNIVYFLALFVGGGSLLFAIVSSIIGYKLIGF